ncbi:MAG TPA: hypothetical protein VNZ52_04550 [Candidatus Thermoplasmatota archaeon]|nr:hypothetical protein [Candidatus Thermoplasmatota archaeon]
MSLAEPPAWVVKTLEGSRNPGESIDSVAVLRSSLLHRLALVRTPTRTLLVAKGLFKARVEEVPQALLGPSTCRWCGAPQNPVPERPGFTFRGFALFKREVDLGGGRRETRYVFSKERPNDAVPCFVPEGFEVAEDPASGLPYLRRAA